MWRTLLAGNNRLAIDDDLFTVVFLSLAGLDFSLWLLGRGFLDLISFSTI